MDSKLYLGVRVELASRFYTVNNLTTRYNKKYQNTHIFDVHKNGKIIMEKKGNFIIARGEDHKLQTGSVNFSVGIDMSNDANNANRIVEIINVLGNYRLIKERVKTFVDGKSLLNSIPELKPLIEAFNNIELIMPGFVLAGWYYAPEVIEKT